MNNELTVRIAECKRRLLSGVHVSSRESIHEFQRTVGFLVHCQRLLVVSNWLQQFVEDGRTRQWPSVNEFVAELVDLWWLILEDVFGVYERPTDEQQCDDGCHHDRQIVVINAELRIYGCVEHGTVHFCVSRNCTHVLRNHHINVCMFSGTEVSVHLSSARAGEYSEHGDSKSGFMYAMSMREFEVLPSYENRAPAMFKQTEELAQAAKKRNVAPIDELARRLKNEIGIEAQAQADARRSYYFGIKKTELLNGLERMLRVIAHRVIDDVLFSKKNRVLFNEAAFKEAQVLAEQSINAYFVKCRTTQTIPNEQTSVAHFATPFLNVHLIPLVEESSTRKSYFATLCSKLWALCHSTPYARGILTNSDEHSRHAIRQTTCTYEQFCLGVLYQKRFGLTIEARDELFCVKRQHIFVTPELALNFDLPPESQIDMFGQKSIVEIERNLASAATKVGYGDRVDKSHPKSALFRNDGRRFVRKQRSNKRAPTLNSTSRTISISEQDIEERTIVPPHLNKQLLTQTGEYNTTDIAHGRNYLQACLNSIQSGQLEKAERSLNRIY